jgi:hypothetical protein
MFKNQRSDSVYVRQPAKLLAMVVFVGAGSWYAYTVSTFNSQYPPIPVSPARYNISTGDSSGIACLDGASLVMKEMEGWAAETERFVVKYGDGDAGWALIGNSAQAVAEHGSHIAQDAQILRGDMGDEEAAFVDAFGAADGKLGEAHRFDEAPSGALLLVNGTFAWAYQACLAASNKDGCEFMSPFPTRQGDDDVYHELLQDLVRIRQQHGQGQDGHFHALHGNTSRAWNALGDSLHFADGNWHARSLAASMCYFTLGRSRCSHYDVAQKQPALLMGMDAFFRGQHTSRYHVHAVHDTFRQAETLGQQLDKWLEREVEDMNESRGGGGGGGGGASAVGGGWTRVIEAWRRVGLSRSFVCA